MNTLYMTVGLPRSGKSTWAKQQNIPIVNPDSIRLEIHGKSFDKKFEDLVWFTAKIMVGSLFRAGHEAVILDATNVTVASRDKWSSDQWNKVGVLFNTPKNTCIERAKTTDKFELIEVIERMFVNWQSPTGNEGFYKIINNL